MNTYFPDAPPGARNQVLTISRSGWGGEGFFRF